MKDLLNRGTILGVTIGVIGAILLLLPFLKKKGVNTEEILENTDQALNSAEGLINVASKVFPGNPTIEILKTIERYVKIAVHDAEQLCIASKLPAGDRNVKAKETIYSVLKLLNIERNEDIDKLVNATIEAETLALGHKEPTEAEKQEQLQQAQAQNTQLQVENTQLKQTIETIQNTVQATQPVATV